MLYNPFSLLLAMQFWNYSPLNSQSNTITLQTVAKKILFISTRLVPACYSTLTKSIEEKRSGMQT